MLHPLETADNPSVVSGEYEINLDTIAAECGLKHCSIRRDRLSDNFKAALDESVAARKENLSQEPKSKINMVNEECKKAVAGLTQPFCCP